MPRRLAAPLLVAALALATACAIPRGEAPARRTRKVAVQEALQSSVRVHVASRGETRRAASGVSVLVRETPQGPVSYVITNQHVVDPHGLEAPSYTVLVEGPQGTRELPAQIAAEGEVPQVDLAVLAVPGVRLPAVALAADDELVVGDDVVVVGAPYGKRLSVSGGMLSQVEVERGQPEMLKTDAPIGYGVSGGGMYSIETGHLMGVIEGYRTAQVQMPAAQGASESYSFDVPMPGETFASPSAKVRRFLAEHHLGPEAPAQVASRK